LQTLLASALCGVLFGIGLTVSQMVDPVKVAAFLDVAGHWDPSLALVMASALAVTSSLYRLALRRTAPLYETHFHVPPARSIDGRLIGGSALFGVGWGLAGLCPGPAVTGLAVGEWPSLSFLAAMTAAIALWEGRRSINALLLKERGSLRAMGRVRRWQTALGRAKRVRTSGCAMNRRVSPVEPSRSAT
jgi:uncharacterized protein